MLRQTCRDDERLCQMEHDSACVHLHHLNNVWGQEVLVLLTEFICLSDSLGEYFAKALKRAAGLRAAGVRASNVP
jgi:hypothetical protein